VSFYGWLALVRIENEGKRSGQAYGMPGPESHTCYGEYLLVDVRAWSGFIFFISFIDFKN